MVLGPIFIRKAETQALGFQESQSEVHARDDNLTRRVAYGSSLTCRVMNSHLV